LRFPTREDIVKLNRNHIDTSGGDWNGPENIINAASLEWVLEAIQYPLFGIDRYPSIEDKAALLAWSIIDGHVFLDGCKRTGISAMEIFIRTNGYRLNATGDEVRDIALKVAKRSEEPYSIDQLTQWVKERIQEHRIININSTVSQIL
jgi:death-on-curing protein